MCTENEEAVVRGAGRIGLPHHLTYKKNFLNCFHTRRRCESRFACEFVNFHAKVFFS